MNTLAFLSSGAVGIVIGWVVKELVEVYKRHEEHRAELRRRFFDDRLSATLKAMQMMKTSSASLRSMWVLIQGDIAAGGNSIDPGVMANTLQSYNADILRVTETTTGAFALLRFFHGEKIARMADDAARHAMVPISQQATVVFSRMTELRASVESLSADQQDAEFARLAMADPDLQANAQDAMRLAVALDERADAIIDELRSVYKPLFGFGYD